jgi:6-phosphogluconolactonase
MPDTLTFPTRDFPDKNSLYTALAAELASLLAQSVTAHGRAAFAVPGGSTPAPLFERLAGSPLPWTSISVTLTDERWVAVDDPASNEGQLRRLLARESAAGVNIVGLHTADADPAAALATCSLRLAGLERPLAAVVLGFGEDGHVASLFPGMAGAQAALDVHGAARYLAVSPPSSAVAPGNRRLSMTLAALLDTRRLILLATGASKKSVIDRAAGAERDAAAWPLTAVLRQTVARPEVWWSP